MNILQKVALFFTILGAINWGTVGLFNFNFVTAIFGDDSVFAKIIYVLIAVCGIINILIFFINLKDERKIQEQRQ